MGALGLCAYVNGAPLEKLVFVEQRELDEHVCSGDGLALLDALEA